MSRYISKNSNSHIKSFDIDPRNDITKSNMVSSYKIGENVPKQPIEPQKTPRNIKGEDLKLIPLEEITFRNVYQFPLHKAKYGGWVYDAIGNFVFQFETDNKEVQNDIIDILNGERDTKNANNQIRYKRFSGEIEILRDEKWFTFITIRGWGNLTGVGSFNLDDERASKIQDTFSEYIVERLQKKGLIF